MISYFTFNLYFENTIFNLIQNWKKNEWGLLLTGSIRVNLNNKFKRKVKDEFYKSFFSDHRMLVKCTFF